MLSLFDKDRATIFSHCCGAATHFNPALPYRGVNTGLLFAMEEITPYDPKHEETFSVTTSQGTLYFAGVTSIAVKSNPAFSSKNTTFSGDYMGTGKLSANNNGIGVFPPDTIKHGQFSGMITNKTFHQFLDHKGVCLWINIVNGKSSLAARSLNITHKGITFYDLLEKYPEFKKEFDTSIIYRAPRAYCNMRDFAKDCLELIITDRG